MAESEGPLPPPYDPNNPQRKFTPVKIGSQYYNSYEELANEFGTKYLTEQLLQIIPLLPNYFAQGNPDIINGIEHTKIENKRDRDLIKQMLEARKNSLSDDGRLAKNESVIAKKKRKMIFELQTIIDNLGRDVEDTKPKAPKQFIKRDELMSLFLDTVAKISASNNLIEVPDNWSDIRETIQKLPLDEAIMNAIELQTVRGKIKEKIPKSNAFKKFLTEGPVATSNTQETKLKGLKLKKHIINLLTFFSVNEKLQLPAVPKKLLKDSATEESIDEYLIKINDVIPGVIDNIKLSYTAINKFNKHFYLRTSLALTKFLNYFKRETKIEYPLDTMIQLNYIMLESERYVFKKYQNPALDPFPKNNGIIKISNLSDASSIIKLIKTYRKFMGTGAGESKELTNELTDSNFDSLNRELIKMHRRIGTDRFVIRGILQLIDGGSINFNEDIMNLYIDNTLKSQLPSETQSKLDQLKTAVKEFFKDRATSIYISFQETPETLYLDKATKIKQLDELQLFMTTVDMAKLMSGPIQLTKIETDTLVSISALKNKDKDKETELMNLCNKFGITMQEELPLVYSITEMTGNILNISAINSKISEYSSKSSTPANSAPANEEAP